MKPRWDQSLFQPQNQPMGYRCGLHFLVWLMLTTPIRLHSTAALFQESRSCPGGAIGCVDWILMSRTSEEREAAPEIGHAQGDTGRHGRPTFRTASLPAKPPWVWARQRLSPPSS